MRAQRGSSLTTLHVYYLCLLLPCVFSFQHQIINGAPRLQNNHKSRYVGSSSSRKVSFRRQESSTVLSLPRMGGTRVSNDKEHDEEDYREKLAEAEVAIAAAEEARRKLVPKKFGGKKRKNSGLVAPPNSLSRLEYTDAGTLRVTISPRGLGSDSLFSGAFSVAWFSAIAPATFAAGAASTLFLLPFWAAGGLVAKNAVVTPFLAARLTVGQYAWSVEKTYLGKVVKQKGGPTAELRGAVAELVAAANNVPRFELRMYGEKGVAAFGLGLSKEELEYLAAEINEHLKKFKYIPEAEVSQNLLLEE